MLPFLLVSFNLSVNTSHHRREPVLILLESAVQPALTQRCAEAAGGGQLLQRKQKKILDIHVCFPDFVCDEMTTLNRNLHLITQENSKCVRRELHCCLNLKHDTGKAGVNINVKRKRG